MLDHKKLAVIHITKKELGLDDQVYREMLEAVAGVRSSRDLDEAGFRKLMRYFARSRHYRAHREGMTFRQKMYIRHLVEDLGWDPAHFNNFLRKYHHQAELEGLSKKEASNIIESLKKILARKFERL
ncbi:MAG: phage protein GemA/Gp16 family protein [Thermodesulfobacteriota bacterium]